VSSTFRREPAVPILKVNVRRQQKNSLRIHLGTDDADRKFLQNVGNAAHGHICKTPRLKYSTMIDHREGLKSVGKLSLTSNVLIYVPKFIRNNENTALESIFSYDCTARRNMWASSTVRGRKLVSAIII
jgi:hypothetical protein